MSKPLQFKSFRFLIALLLSLSTLTACDENDKRENLASSTPLPESTVIRPTTSSQVEANDDSLAAFTTSPSSSSFLYKEGKYASAGQFNGQTILFNNEGIGLMNDLDGTLEQVSSNVYEGQEQNAIRQLFHEAFGSQAFSWNSGVKANSDGSQLAYVSSKGSPSAEGNDVFVLDTETGVETRLTHTEGVVYEVVGWNQSERVFCLKNFKPILLSMDGTETPLQLVEQDAYAYHYSMQDGLISYTTYLEDGSNAFNVVKLDALGDTQTIFSDPMGGYSRKRSYTRAFSPDGSHAAFLYSPKEDLKQGKLKIVDLETQQIATIDTLPDGSNHPFAILSFAWIDNDILQVELLEDREKQKATKTWTYSVSDYKYMDEVVTEISPLTECGIPIPGAFTQREVYDFDLLRSEWTKEDMAKLPFDNSVEYTDFSNDTVSYRFTVLYESPTPILIDVYGQHPGPRGIMVGDSFDQVIALFPDEMDWKTTGILYGGESDMRGQPLGLSAYASQKGASGEQEIRLFTEDIFPSLTLYFQDDALTHYTFAMGGGD